MWDIDLAFFYSCIYIPNEQLLGHEEIVKLYKNLTWDECTNTTVKKPLTIFSIDS